MKPLVTVVIPSYNSARWLGGAIRSVLAQTYSPMEVIVIDDGSTDGTPEVVSPFGSVVRYVRQDNAGVSNARNRGATEARGEFVAFLDSDDEWLPRKLEVQMERVLRRPDAVASFMSMIQVDDRTGVREAKSYRFEPDLLERLLLYSCIVGAPSSVLMRRAVFLEIGGFDPAFSQCADWDMWLRLVGVGPVDVIEEPFVLYHLHQANMSRNAALLEADTLGVLNKFYSSSANALRYGHLRRRAYGNHYLILSGSYLHCGKLPASLRCAVRAAILHPPNLVRVLGTPWRLIRRACSP